VGTFGTSPAVSETGSGTLHPLALGWCDVDVPLDRHRVGAVERPTWWTLDWRDWKEDPSRHFVIVKRNVDPYGFWPQVAQAASDDGVLVFIHGFNVAFDAAVFKTAQLAHDLEFHGAPILYSWASAATSRDYVADKERNEATVPLLKEFLVQLADRTPNRKIHIIAHSMGNRALIQALGQLAEEQRGPHLTEVIMAAPDVDRRVFLGLAPAFVRTAERITLYASGSDKVLQLAKQLERGPRAGDANPVLTVQGIESIDASLVSTDFLAHSYYSDPRLLNDINSLIKHNGGLPRFSIEGVPRVNPVSWRFLPEH
jgi:esterase/lipase superfamily enzyme